GCDARVRLRADYAPGVQHARQLNVEGESRLAGDLLRRIEPIDRLADHFQLGVWGQRRRLVGRNVTAHLPQRFFDDSVEERLRPGGPLHRAAPLRLPVPRARAAAKVASNTLGYVPQRHRWPLTAAFTSSSVHSGFRSTSAAQLITMPGVQKPQCLAACSMNGC